MHLLILHWKAKKGGHSLKFKGGWPWCSLALCILCLVDLRGHKGKSPSLCAGGCGTRPHWQSTGEHWTGRHESLGYEKPEEGIKLITSSLSPSLPPSPLSLSLPLSLLPWDLPHQIHHHLAFHWVDSATPSFPLATESMAEWSLRWWSKDYKWLQRQDQHPNQSQESIRRQLSKHSETTINNIIVWREIFFCGVQFRQRPVFKLFNFTQRKSSPLHTHCTIIHCINFHSNC